MMNMRHKLKGAFEMIRKIDHRDMGKGSQSFVESIFHFSFASYQNPHNVNFGVLRVVNDDIIQPHTGFESHPHKDMEIITYVVNGTLTHGDDMGNENSIGRGNIQYFSAGTGVMHSEHNQGDEILRILQIWIFPDQEGHEPNYGDVEFDWEDRKNRWLHMVSDRQGQAPIKINQDANLFVTSIDSQKEIDFVVESGRQAYLIQIEGNSQVNDFELGEKDAMEVIDEPLKIRAVNLSHLMIIEMKQTDS
jgi:quercetin 2,3-dioxygenase